MWRLSKIMWIFFVVGEIVINFDTKIVYLVLLQVYVYLNDTDAPLQTFQIGLKWGTFQWSRFNSSKHSQL
jgi:hypothetical protein